MVTSYEKIQQIELRQGIFDHYEIPYNEHIVELPANKKIKHLGRDTSMKSTELLNACADFIKNIPDNLNYITPSELRKILEESSQSILVLDVRNTESYRESHIEGAINICIDDIFQEENMAKIPIGKPVVVCCGIGHVASQILTLLQLLGYNAIALKYGMGVSTVAGEVQKGWVELGYPVMSCDPTC